MSLTGLDIVICIFLLLYFLLGLRRGFFISLGTLGGFLLGAVGAFWLTPLVVQHVGTGWYIVAALFTIMFCLLIGQWLGYLVGSTLRKISDSTPLRGFERFAGGILNLTIGVLVLVTVALVVKPLAIPQISAALTESQVMSTLLKYTPESVKTSVNDVRNQAMNSGTIPEIGEILFPPQEVPTETLDNAALQVASQSVVQILGTAQACNYISEGSGFVTAPGYSVTNAHVLEGVTEPVVQDREGNAYPGSVVYMDKEQDLAIIYAPDMPLNALAIGEDMPAGSTVSFMGYPGGGPFTARTATVQGLGYTQTVNAENGETNQSRLVYQLAADVQQGNSGGPVLDESGNVVGVIFAKAPQGQVGYAIPASVLSEALAGLSTYTAPVNTGACQTH